MQGPGPCPNAASSPLSAAIPCSLGPAASPGNPYTNFTRVPARPGRGPRGGDPLLPTPLAPACSNDVINPKPSSTWPPPRCQNVVSGASQNMVRTVSHVEGAEAAPARVPARAAPAASGPRGPSRGNTRPSTRRGEGWATTGRRGRRGRTTRRVSRGVRYRDAEAPTGEWRGDAVGRGQ